MPYELRNIRREHWLPPFPAVERYDRDREDCAGSRAAA